MANEKKELQKTIAIYKKYFPKTYLDFYGYRSATIQLANLRSKKNNGKEKS